MDRERDRVVGFLEHSRSLTSKDQSRLMTLTHHFEPGGQDKKVCRRNACPGAHCRLPGQERLCRPTPWDRTRVIPASSGTCAFAIQVLARNHPYVDDLRRHREDDPLELRDRLVKPDSGAQSWIAPLGGPAIVEPRRHTDHQQQQRPLHRAGRGSRLCGSRPDVTTVEGGGPSRPDNTRNAVSERLRSAGLGVRHKT